MVLMFLRFLCFLNYLKMRKLLKLVKKLNVKFVTVRFSTAMKRTDVLKTTERIVETVGILYIYIFPAMNYERRERERGGGVITFFSFSLYRNGFLNVTSFRVVGSAGINLVMLIQYLLLFPSERIP